MDIILWVHIVCLLLFKYWLCNIINSIINEYIVFCIMRCYRSCLGGIRFLMVQVLMMFVYQLASNFTHNILKCTNNNAWPNIENVSIDTSMGMMYKSCGRNDIHARHSSHVTCRVTPTITSWPTSTFIDRWIKSSHTSLSAPFLICKLGADGFYMQ